MDMSGNAVETKEGPNNEQGIRQTNTFFMKDINIDSLDAAIFEVMLTKFMFSFKKAGLNVGQIKGNYFLHS